jgi:hypothetical protein
VPLTWTANRDTKLVEVRATGRLRQRDIADYFTDIVKARAAFYRALFDISVAEVELELG